MICCFGELLLRFSPASNGKWIDQSVMPVYLGGSELNVATALSCWGLPVKFITAIPDNQLSTDILRHLQRKNIYINDILFSGNRIGTYYLPTGSELKNASVIYDRAYSSFASLKTGMLNWDQVLDGCSWFHFTAITPALNENMPALCEEALMAAKQKGITISVDLNYRSRLWQYGVKPHTIMPSLIKYCDVIMGNIWSAESLLGIEYGNISSSAIRDEELIEAARNTILQLRQQFLQIQSIACTFRMNEKYFAVLDHENSMVLSQKFKLQQVVDKAGSGDCFMAGLIYGLINDHEPLKIVNFAAAAAVGKLAEAGDSTRQSVEQIQKRIL